VFTLPPRSPSRDKICTEAEVRAVIKRLPKALHPITWTAYYIGWRRGELVSRLRTDLTPDGVLYLDKAHAKNRTARAFPVYKFPQLIEVLKANEHRRAELQVELGRTLGRIVPISTLFFADHHSPRKGGPLGDWHHTWNRAVKVAVEAGEVTLNPGQKLVFHNMRHTANTEFRRSMDPQTAQKLVGHKSASVNDLYTHMQWQDMEEGVAQHALRLKQASEKVVQQHHGNVVQLFPAYAQPTPDETAGKTQVK
jgi:integrase